MAAGATAVAAGATAVVAGADRSGGRRHRPIGSRGDGAPGLSSHPGCPCRQALASGLSCRWKTAGLVAGPSQACSLRGPCLSLSSVVTVPWCFLLALVRAWKTAGLVPGLEPSVLVTRPESFVSSVATAPPGASSFLRLFRVGECFFCWPEGSVPPSPSASGIAGIGIGNGDRAPGTTHQQARCEHANTCSDAQMRRTHDLLPPATGQLASIPTFATLSHGPTIGSTGIAN